MSPWFEVQFACGKNVSHCMYVDDSNVFKIEIGYMLRLIVNVLLTSISVILIDSYN